MGYMPSFSSLAGLLFVGGLFCGVFLWNIFNVLFESNPEELNTSFWKC